MGESISWRLGANLVLTGGFATPEGVVGAFGGRAAGFVSGAVFHDENGDGVRGDAELPIEGITVTAGDASTTTDSAGRFRLVLSPGRHTFSVSGAAASYGLLNPPEVNVEVGEEYEVNLPLDFVATIAVKVFDDQNRNGVADANEPLLPRSAVIVQASDGSREIRYTDRRGEAIFQNLRTGHYTVLLDPESLPSLYEATHEPLAVELEPGPVVGLELGAAEPPKVTVQTLRSGDLTMVARLDPMHAPPGADVLILAQVDGDPNLVEATLGNEEAVPLTLVNGSYQGRLSVPKDAQGVLMVTVRAQRGVEERTQQLPLIVAPGPLVRFTTSPTVAGPGEAVAVEATFLMLVSRAEVVLVGTRYPLSPTDDPYRFVGVVPAPSDEGSHLMELFTDGEKSAEARFRVQ